MLTKALFETITKTEQTTSKLNYASKSSTSKKSSQLEYLAQKGPKSEVMFSMRLHMHTNLIF